MKELVKDIIIAVVIAIVVLQFIKPVIVKESSMENNFIENDYLLLSKQSYLWGDIERGDVVVFESSLLDDNGADKLLIKRAIGLPGETVSVHDGDVFINGKKLDEPYTKDGYTSGTVEDTKLASDEVFCMGDNRLVSIDSRDPEVGPIDTSKIKGKVVFRLFPFNKIGTTFEPEYNGI